MGPQNSPVWSENALLWGTLKIIKEALVETSLMKHGIYSCQNNPFFVAKYGYLPIITKPI